VPNHRGSRGIAAGAILVSVALLQPLTAVAAATHTVAIDGTSYAPAMLTVKRGDRVVWKNSDPFPHTATATNKAFDSKSIAAGASWSWVASKPGRYDYVCTFHPTMKATLVVE
jgi:plastocyanin